MTNEQKKEIQQLTLSFIGRQGSQNRAAVAIGVSAATLSQVSNGKWDLIADEMWHRLGKAVGWTAPEWSYAETSVSRKIAAHLDLARDRRVGNITAITAPAGSGKTFTAERHAAANPDDVLVRCKRGMTVRRMYGSMLRAMGASPDGLSTERLEAAAHERIAKRAKPEVWLELVCLYNELRDRCCIVTLSTSVFRTRVENGVSAGRLGLDELHSRLGGRFVDAGAPTAHDMAAIAIANGLSEPGAVSRAVERGRRLGNCDLRVGSDSVRAIREKLRTEN